MRAVVMDRIGGPLEVREVPDPVPPRGGVVVEVRVIGWELDLLGSHGMAAADYPRMLALIESGALAPQDLIERVIGLSAAAALLPVFDKASPAGMTMIDPRIA